MRVRRTAGIVAAWAVVVGTVVAGGAPADAARRPEARSGFPVVPVSWHACPSDIPSLAPFQCADVVVPLDWSKPQGRTISLGVVRHAARKPAQRVGVLFFNPGGPSDQGSVFLPPLVANFDPRVQDRYDLVSWDPRGMGGLSSPVVQCFDSLDAETAFLDGVAFPPVTAAERRPYAERLAAFNRHCGGRDDELLAHVSTADNARDLDYLSRALGQKRTDYYGTSYGTFLGNTYANMFPSRVGRIVLDGTVDPLAWTRARGPLSTFVRIGSDRAWARTLASYFRECTKAGPVRCEFAERTTKATARKYYRLLARAGTAGIEVQGQTFTRNDIVGTTLGSLYVVHPLPGFDRFIGWTELGQILEALWDASSAPTKAAARTRLAPGTAARAAAAASYMGQERQPAVVCGESPNPTTVRTALTNARISVARAGLGGATWPWIGYCVGWPVKAASPYEGPFNRVKAHILVIGVTGDPATPYDNAVHVARELPGGRLLTVVGYGHTALANGSACAESKVADYLLTGALPRRGTRCAENLPPFVGAA